MPENQVTGKVAIVGAGRVGSTIAFALMNSGVASDIVVIDIDEERAEGEAMDLRHGASFVRPVDVRAGDYDDVDDADVVVITAGVSQQPGETRLELLERNAAVFEDMVPKITDGLADDAILLVVTNPVDVLTYVTWRVSGLPAERVIGSGTVLDTARFRNVLGEDLGVAEKNIHAYVVGEHGDSEVPVWSATHLAGMDFDHYVTEVLEEPALIEHKEAIGDRVRGAAYEIIDRKGATYYAIGLAAREIVEAILRDEDAILTVSTLLTGQYGIEDVYMSLPCVVDRGGIERVTPLAMSDDERAAFRESGEKLKDEIDRLDR